MIVAKCVEQGKEPEFFYPQPLAGRPARGNEGDQLDRLQTLAARYCNGSDDKAVCEYKTQCLDMGLYAEESGVWGGTTEAERRVMLRSIRKPRVEHIAIDVAVEV